MTAPRGHRRRLARPPRSSGAPHALARDPEVNLDAGKALAFAAVFGSLVLGGPGTGIANHDARLRAPVVTRSLGTGGRDEGALSRPGWPGCRSGSGCRSRPGSPGYRSGWPGYRRCRPGGRGIDFRACRASASWTWRTLLPPSPASSRSKPTSPNARRPAPDAVVPLTAATVAGKAALVPPTSPAVPGNGAVGCLIAPGPPRARASSTPPATTQRGRDHAVHAAPQTRPLNQEIKA